MPEFLRLIIIYGWLHIRLIIISRKNSGIVFINDSFLTICSCFAFCHVQYMRLLKKEAVKSCPVHNRVLDHALIILIQENDKSLDWSWINSNIRFHYICHSNKERTYLECKGLTRMEEYKLTFLRSQKSYFSPQPWVISEQVTASTRCSNSHRVWFFSIYCFPRGNLISDSQLFSLFNNFWQILYVLLIDLRRTHTTLFFVRHWSWIFYFMSS